MKNPLVLITNDDGINAPGIRNLISVVKHFTNNILVVAPDSPQSGMGHAITLNSALRINKVELADVEAYSCSGTPVDCVKIAVSTLLDEKPDLIVSGINHGSNSSINVIYSGTMSAALEGAIEGVPSIGFSLCDNSIDANFNPCLPFAKTVINYALKKKLGEHTCLNVNFPKLDEGLIKGIKVCRQANAVWEETFDKRIDPTGKSYYWLTGSFVNKEPTQKDTDEWALANNYVSIVPVQYDVTSYNEIVPLKEIEDEKEFR